MAKTDKTAAGDCLTKLRNLGNHKHNCDVLSAGCAVLVVTYRPSQGDVDPASYAPCPHCYGYYEVTQLWKHVKLRCRFKTNDSDTAKVVAHARNLLPVPDGVHQNTRTILSVMHRDKIYRVAVNDELVMQLAHKLTMKHFSDVDKHGHVRCKIREMGRLLVCLKEDRAIGSVCQALDPANFKNVVSCVRKVAGYTEGSNSYDRPSLALKLGHSVKKCSTFLRSKALQETNAEMLRRADAFDSL